MADASRFRTASTIQHEQHVHLAASGFRTVFRMGPVHLLCALRRAARVRHLRQAPTFQTGRARLYLCAGVWNAAAGKYNQDRLWTAAPACRFRTRRLLPRTQPCPCLQFVSFRAFRRCGCRCDLRPAPATVARRCHARAERSVVDGAGAHRYRPTFSVRRVGWPGIGRGDCGHRHARLSASALADDRNHPRTNSRRTLQRCATYLPRPVRKSRPASLPPDGGGTNTHPAPWKRGKARSPA